MSGMSSAVSNPGLASTTVGTALTSGRFGFVADVVMLDGAAHARAGRTLKPNARMERVR